MVVGPELYGFLPDFLCKLGQFSSSNKNLEIGQLKFGG
jgi:hypothetical protein